MTCGKLLDVVGALHTTGAVPENVQSYGRADAGEPVNLPGIAEFLFGGGGRSWLDEFSETRAGIGEAPRGQLNAKGVQRLKHLFTLACIHQRPLGQSTASLNLVGQQC